MLVGLGIYLAVLVFLFLVRKKVGLFWTAAAFIVATLVWLEAGFEPPLPSSVRLEYGGTMILAVLLYVTSSEDGRDSFWSPIRRIMVEPDKRGLLILMMLLVPGIVAWQSYQMTIPSSAPPPKIRSVHPSPPSALSFKGPGDTESVNIDLIAGHNPLRDLQEKDEAAYAAAILDGKRVYYENCYFCHGDTMAADGHYGPAVYPPPASFVDKGTIAMLQETYLFWRVAKGGPGLPDAGTPWDSTMPVWENFLSEEEIWSVILYLYEYTGYEPRGAVDLEGGH